MKYLINKFDDVNVAIVAYNAGEGTVASWLKNKEYSHDEKTLYKIPYLESENYLKKVTRAIKIYKERI